MVVQTSDSYNTFVSLQDGLKQVPSESSAANGTSAATAAGTSSDELVRTELYLPLEEPFGLENDELLGIQSNDNSKQPEQPIYLPTRSSGIPVDRVLRYVPELVERCDELLANQPRHFTEQSTEKLLYVAQGEVAHAVPFQCDVILSDKATTCHIVALRSESRYGDALPLSSLAHIDGCGYEQSIRSMFLEHLRHHDDSRYCDEESTDRNTEVDYDSSSDADTDMNMSASIDDRVQVDVHILGGFDDEDSTSSKISTWFLNLLTDIAQEERDSIKITLKTCAVSSMNDDGRFSPIGRGLGIDTSTGEVFLAKADHQVTGPSPVLRSVRLFSNSDQAELSLIHSAASNDLQIKPFLFGPFEELPSLLSLPDHILLQYCSTSPTVEEEDFCRLLRSSLRYLRDQSCTHIFGPRVDQTLVYRRCGRTNHHWKQVS